MVVDNKAWIKKGLKRDLSLQRWKYIEPPGK
jgi:hypothetical protein